MRDITLDIKFEKDTEKQYAVLKGEDIEEYGMKMLQSNKPAGILEVQIKNRDNKKWYYYNITKKSSLEQLLEKKQVSIECMEAILMQIFHTLETAKDYLLDERNLVLETKMIYLSADNPETTELCYYPSYQTDNMEQIVRLLEIFLNEIDYKKEEKRKIEQFYRIYDKARENGMTCKELSKELQKKYGNKESKTEKEETPAFHFERAEQVMKQTNGLEQHEVSQHVCSKDKMNLSKELSGKQEIKKTDMRKRENKKQTNETQKGNTQKTAFQIKNFLTLCFILVFTGVIIGTAIVTKIFDDSATGTMDYSKFGILCVIIAVMDFFAWKYLKQEEKENKTVEFLQLQSQKKTENMAGKTTKDENEELEDIISGLEQLDINKNISKEDGMENISLSGKTEHTFLGEQETELKGTQLLVEEDTILLPQEETVLLQPIEKMWKLVALEGKEIKEIVLERFPFYLGKQHWNVDGAIDHPSISRVHSKFEKLGDVLYVTDLDSTNGTYLNHIKLGKDEKREIKEGDEVSFANVRFRLEVKNGLEIT